MSDGQSEGCGSQPEVFKGQLEGFMGHLKGSEGQPVAPLKYKVM